LNYTVNRKLGTCEINVLKEAIDAQDVIVDGNLLALKNSSSFFDFDGVPYQYVGLVCYKKNIFNIILILILIKNFFKEKSRWS
jgi:hypothetical protein